MTRVRILLLFALLTFGNLEAGNVSFISVCHPGDRPSLSGRGVITYSDDSDSGGTGGGTGRMGTGECTANFHNPLQYGYTKFSLKMNTSSCLNRVVVSELYFDHLHDTVQTMIREFSAEFDRDVVRNIIYDSFQFCKDDDSTQSLTWSQRSDARFFSVAVYSNHSNWNFSIDYETDIDCSIRQYKCRVDKVCIPMSQFCDGVHNCVDETDEESCQGPLLCQGEKPFYCDQERICLSESDLCDGTSDCWQTGQDESQCTVIHLNVRKNGLWITAITLSVIVLIVVVIIIVYKIHRYIRRRRFLKYRDLSMHDLLKVVDELT